MDSFVVRQSGQQDIKHAGIICEQIQRSAEERGTGIGKRDPSLIAEKIASGHAVIAVHEVSGEPAGFCYLAAWDQETMVSHCALIIFPEFRHKGLGRKIKTFAVELSEKLFPGAKIFGLTTSLSVMKINTSLGYQPVTFREISKDPGFWSNCRGCINHKILESTGGKNCFCTSMLRISPEQTRTDSVQEEKRA